MSIRDPRTVVIRPVVSEKSYEAMEDATYRFVVSNDANKVQIRQAIEEIFGVRVTNVNTLNRAGKSRRNRRTGTSNSRPTRKHAIVTLHPDDKIEIFGS